MCNGGNGGNCGRLILYLCNGGKGGYATYGEICTCIKMCVAMCTAPEGAHLVKPLHTSVVIRRRRSLEAVKMAASSHRLIFRVRRGTCRGKGSST